MISDTHIFHSVTVKRGKTRGGGARLQLYARQSVEGGGNLLAYRSADQTRRENNKSFSAPGFSYPGPPGSTRSGPWTWTSSEASRGVREAHKPAGPGRGITAASDRARSFVSASTWGSRGEKGRGRTALRESSTDER